MEIHIFHRATNTIVKVVLIQVNIFDTEICIYSFELLNITFLFGLLSRSFEGIEYALSFNSELKF